MDSVESCASPPAVLVVATAALVPDDLVGLEPLDRGGERCADVDPPSYLRRPHVDDWAWNEVTTATRQADCQSGRHSPIATA